MACFVVALGVVVVVVVVVVVLALAVIEVNGIVVALSVILFPRSISIALLSCSLSICLSACLSVYLSILLFGAVAFHLLRFAFALEIAFSISAFLSPRFLFLSLILIRVLVERKHEHCLSESFPLSTLVLTALSLSFEARLPRS